VEKEEGKADVLPAKPKRVMSEAKESVDNCPHHAHMCNDADGQY
jgi:hypothetical protein